MESPRPAALTSVPNVTCASCGAPFAPAVAGQSLCDRCQGLLPSEPLTSPMRDTVVAGYRLAHELGAGRFSSSWLGEDPVGVAVVVKLLRSYAPDSGSVQRFMAEAQRLASSRDLDHPNVAHLLSGGVAIAQSLFLVYQSGGEQTLADELRARGRVATGRALELCAQLAEGLAAMHRVGVLHLDLKPANVALTRLPDGTEQAVLLDVATAHLLAQSGVRPSMPLPLATAAYLSPEEAAGRPADGRADLYSLGVLLYQLVSGRLPFMGATAEALLAAHREQAPLRLSDAGRKVNGELEALLARLLAKEPAQRFSSGDELAVVMRSLIPIADTAPMEDGPAAVDDPLPVVEAPRPEPEVATAPVAREVATALDPALERALLGEVPPQPADQAPGVPDWMPRLWPAWWPRVAIAAGVAIALLVALMLSRGSAPRAPRAAGARAAGARAVAPPATERAGSPSNLNGAPPTSDRAAESSAAATPATAPPAGRAAVQPSGGDEVTHGPPSSNAASALARAGAAPAAGQRSRPSPFAKQFDRAQKQLWTSQVPAAEATLQQILARPHLARRDRARASKMIGDAEAKRGNRPAARDWYRKAVKLYDVAADREKVARQLQALGR